MRTYVGANGLPRARAGGGILDWQGSMRSMMSRWLEIENASQAVWGLAGIRHDQ